MSAEELLDRLALMGVTLAAEGGRLKVTAPTGAVSPSLRAELEQAKPALLAQVGGTRHTPPLVGSATRVGTGASPEGVGLPAMAVIGIVAVVLLMVWLASRSQTPAESATPADPFGAFDQRPFTIPFGRPPSLGW